MKERQKDSVFFHPILHPSSLRKAGRQGSMAMDTGSCLIKIHDPFSVGPGGMKCEIGRKFISRGREPAGVALVGSLREGLFLSIPAQAGLRKGGLDGVDEPCATPERFGFAG